MINISKTRWRFFSSARGVWLVLCTIALAFTLGCGGVSDEDLSSLKAENVALEAELEQERQQSEILNRALTNAYKERDRLVDALNAEPVATDENAQGATDGSEPAAGSEAAQGTAGDNRYYVVKAGDTLSLIAQRHNTTVATLLRLNSQLLNRNDYMVWENERINLPR